MAEGDKGIRPDRVAIYIRWSTEEQGEGTTLTEQTESCEFYIKSQGWFVNPSLIFIDDGYSGGNLDRPGMKRLRDLVLNGEADCVVVLKIDRLSRNIVDAVQLVLEEWKDRCHLRCVRQPIDTTSETGRMFFSILATFADFERAQITERTYQGRIRRIKEGKAYGGPVVPYGLLPTGEPGVRVLDPAKASIVAEMFRRTREERATVLDLLRWLESQGAPPPAAQRWNLNTVRRILRNPIYSGRLVYGEYAHIKKAGRKTPYKQKRAEPSVVAEAVTVPAIVTPDVFNEVQSILDGRTEFHAKHRRASEGLHLLSGVARCKCGATMNVHWSHGEKYYICSKRVMAGSNGCTADNGVVLADKVEKTVVDDLLALYGMQSDRRATVSRVAGQTSVETAQIERERAKTDEEIRKLNLRLAGLREQAGAGEITLEEWRELRAGVESKRSQFERKEAELKSRKNQAARGLIQERQLMEAMSRLDRWWDLPPADQKDLLRSLAESIEVFKPRGRGQPYQIKVVWRFNPTEVSQTPD